MRHARVLAVWAALGGAGAAPAQAATCAMAETGASFGSVSSFSVRLGGLSTLGSFSATCGSGALLSVLSSDRFKATLTSDNGLLLRNAADPAKTIAYVVDNGSAPPHTLPYVAINASGLSLLTVLLARKATVPVRLTTQPANVPAGTYRDMLRLTWEYSFCDLVSVLTGCIGTVYAGTETRTVPVELQVYNDCAITPGSINFGSAALPIHFAEAASQMSLICTTGMTYSVGLGPGDNAVAGRRQMRIENTGNFLAYDIFFAGNTTPWGTAEGTRVMSSQAVSGPAAGMADGTTAHVFPYRARVYPDQTPPPAGTYKDKVVINVQF